MSTLTARRASEVNPFRVLSVRKLDAKYYANVYQSNLFKEAVLFFKNRRGYFFLVDGDTKKIVGYISVVFLRDKYYEIMKSGNLPDSSLPFRAFCRMSKKHPNNVYFSSIAIADEFRSPDAFSVLLSALENWLIESFDKSFFVSHLLADFVSEEGLHLAKLLQFEKVTDTERGTAIYETNFCPPAFHPINSAMRKLYRLYREKYEKNDELRQKPQ